jgi:hypothetical protein
MRVLLVAIVLFALVTTIAAQFNFGNAFGTAAAFLGGSLIGSSLGQGTRPSKIKRICDIPMHLPIIKRRNPVFH